MPKNRYVMSYAILTFRADFEVFVSLYDECLYSEFFSLARIIQVIFRGFCIIPGFFLQIPQSLFEASKTIPN